MLVTPSLIWRMLLLQLLPGTDSHVECWCVAFDLAWCRQRLLHGSIMHVLLRGEYCPMVRAPLQSVGRYYQFDSILFTSLWCVRFHLGRLVADFCTYFVFFRNSIANSPGCLLRSRSLQSRWREVGSRILWAGRATPVYQIPKCKRDRTTSF